ncbi:MAG: hypothetical protein KL787_01635 [Taibaiella sp.]|nr:hypothetical protein [Taibaiella sp.]
MRQILTSLTAVIFSFSPLMAQDDVQPSGKMKQFEGKVYGGYGTMYSDVPTTKNHMVYGADFGYAVLPYLNIHLDLQTGKYKGGDRTSDRQYYMEFTNQFFSAGILGKWYPLKMVSQPENKQNPTALKHFQGLYISTGLGFHFNNVKAFNTSNPDIGYLNNNKDVNMYVPAELGISYPIVHFGKEADASASQRFLFVNVAYRYNFNFSDSWDGYDPALSSNQHNDASSVFLLGVGINF